MMFDITVCPFSFHSLWMACSHSWNPKTDRSPSNRTPLSLLRCLQIFVQFHYYTRKARRLAALGIESAKTEEDVKQADLEHQALL